MWVASSQKEVSFIEKNVQFSRWWTCNSGQQCGAPKRYKYSSEISNDGLVHSKSIKSVSCTHSGGPYPYCKIYRLEDAIYFVFLRLLLFKFFKTLHVPVLYPDIAQKKQASAWCNSNKHRTLFEWPSYFHLEYVTLVMVCFGVHQSYLWVRKGTRNLYQFRAISK